MDDLEYPYFLETPISLYIPFKGNFEDDFPIPMVGYVIMWSFPSIVT